jgi:KAP family P-loop domain
VLEVLHTVPACALVVGRSGLPGEWGRRELGEAARRKRADPAFRFLLIYLPEAEPVATEALALGPDAVITFKDEIEPEGVAAVVAALGTQARGPTAIELSPSVAAATRLPGAVTSFTIVRRLVESHPEYAGGRLADSALADVPAGAPERTAEEWLADVKQLYDPRRAPVLHGQLLIDGLARIDRDLRGRLEQLDALAPIRQAITPPVQSLLRQKRDAVETLTDHPAKVDELGRAVIARKLAKLMRRVRANETAAHADDPDRERRRGGPFLLHLYGRWGSGKTSLLYFLRAQLEESVRAEEGAARRRTLVDAVRRRNSGLTQGDPLDRWIVIEFNAWQHQRIVPPWWWLMAAVSREGSRALRALDAPRWLSLKAWDYGWRLRGAIPGLVLVGVGLLIGLLVWKSGTVNTDSWPSAVTAGATVATALSGILALLLTVWGGVKAMSRWLLVGSPRAAGTVLAHSKDPLDSLSRRFSTLVSKLHYPVAIFVDDLDRCQARYVVELLEGVQTLFKNVPVAYVVAADRNWVCERFEREYQDFCTVLGDPGRPLGHLFLEKTFQVSVPIPALSDEIQRKYLERLLSATSANGDAALDRARRDAVKRFQALTTREEIDTELRRRTPASPLHQQAAAEAAVLRLAEPDLEKETEHMLQAFAPLLEPNPRSMKRLVNAYGIVTAVEILRDVAEIGMNVPDTSAPERLALWTILSLRWPLLGDYLAENPEAADDIRAGKPPPDGAPEWLKTLWVDEDVHAVLHGKAPHVSIELDSGAIALCTGRRR